MATFTYLQSAAINEVLDASTGLTYDANEIVGDDDHAIKLRTKLLENIENESPLYLCPACFKAIYLRSNPEKSGQYFVHRDVEGNCPKLEAKNLSEKQIRAIKYNGAKESPAHIETKQFLMDCLEADPNFTDQEAEKVWVSETDKGKFRRPDVQAFYDNGIEKLRVAFEIQLSATFLSEIVQRREFYRKEGALLVWVFRNFVEQDPRLTQLDIFYPNNLNAFVVSQKTRNASLECGKLQLQCHWAEPQVDSNGEISKVFNQRLIPFDDLTLDQKEQQAFYFDYKAAERDAKRQVKEIELRALAAQLKEYGKKHSWSFDDPEIKRLRPLFEKHGVLIPESTVRLHRLITSLSSLEEGRPIGSGFTRLVEFGHKLYDVSPDLILYFLAASNAYGRKDELTAYGNAEKWKAKKEKIRDELIGNSTSRFLPDKELAPFVFLLFPDVKKAFDNLASHFNKLRGANMFPLG